MWPYQSLGKGKRHKFTYHNKVAGHTRDPPASQKGAGLQKNEGSLPGKTYSTYTLRPNRHGWWVGGRPGIFQKRAWAWN